jgi:membrane AbrB-like protein
MRRVTIAQCIRLFFLIAALPAFILWLSPPEATIAAAPVIGSLGGIALMVILSVVAGFGLERLRVPAGIIVGPAIVAASLELSGIIHGAPPNAILIPANIVLGVMIAARFNAFTFAEFRQALREGFTGFVVALAISMVGAWLAAALGGLPLALTLLAFSPGGLDAMILMAFALDLDPAYVGAHQIARYAGMVLLMPMVTAWLLGRINGLGGKTLRLEGE